MNADCSFRIGRDHAVCQDYGVARSGELSFAILADGCSSSPDTDLGARLLVRSAERVLPHCLHSVSAPLGDGGRLGELVREYHRRAIEAAREQADGLGLDPRSLDATLLTLVAGQGQWLALLYGDGVLAVGWHGVRPEPAIQVEAVSFSGGYPDYPSYLVDAERRRAFERLPDNRRQVEGWLLTAKGSERGDRPAAGVQEGGCYVATGSAEQVDWLAVLTDGAGSFSAVDPQDRTAGRLPLAAVLPELLAFKSRTGVFVQRRVQRFLKECEARGRTHHDDLGVAAIAVR